MSRRAPGTGCVKPYKGNRWRVTISKMIGGERVQWSKVFDRRRDAEAWQREQADAPSVPAGTLAEWLAEWEPIHQSKTAPQTHLRDGETITTHILGRLGGVRLRDLTPMRVESYLAELMRDGVSSSERKRAATTLRKVLNAALRDDRISANPFDRVAIPKHRPAEVRPMTAEQLGRLFGAAGEIDPLYEFGFRLWVDGAMRPGEWLALRWDDLDAAKATIRIERSLDQKTHAVRVPKTARSRRTVPVSKHTLASLARIGGPRRPGPMFPNGRGGHLRATNFLKSVFRPIVEVAGLEWATPYTLRHTAASLLLSNGCSLPTVSARLGHEKTSVTLDTYAHVMPNDQARATAILETILDPRATRLLHESPQTE